MYPKWLFGQDYDIYTKNFQQDNEDTNVWELIYKCWAQEEHYPEQNYDCLQSKKLKPEVLEED